METSEFLRDVYLGNSVYSWAKFFAFSLVAFSILFIFVRLALVRFIAFAERTSNTVDDLIAKVLSRTYKLSLLAIALYMGSYILELNERVESIKSTLLVAVLIFQCVAWLSEIAHYFVVDRRQRRNLTLAQAKFISLFLRMVLWILAIFLLCENVGIKITPLLAGFGIGGIAIALAVQSVLGDVISSLSIIIDKPFVVGDYIVVGEFAGTVENVGLKTTRVRSLSGELIVFSNNDLVSNRIKNYKGLPRRRSFSVLGVVYETPAEKLERIPLIIKEILEENDGVEYDRVHFVKFGDFSLNFEIAYYVLTSDYITFLNSQQKVNFCIVRRFREEGIEFAYPTQKLFMEKIYSAPES